MEKSRSSPSQAAALHVRQFAPSSLLSNGCCCAALPTTPLAPLFTLQQLKQGVPAPHTCCVLADEESLLPCCAKELCCLPASGRAAAASILWVWLPARTCKVAQLLASPQQRCRTLQGCHKDYCLPCNLIDVARQSCKEGPLASSIPPA